MRRAYDDLEREGLVWSRPGKGFWVADIPGPRKRQLAEERFGEALKELVARGAAEGLSSRAMRRILDDLLEQEVNR